MFTQKERPWFRTHRSVAVFAYPLIYNHKSKESLLQLTSQLLLIVSLLASKLFDNLAG